MMNAEEKIMDIARTIIVDRSSLLIVLEENKRLREQVTALQERMTQMVMERQLANGR